MTKNPPNRRGISFEVGAQLEARDRLKKWYAAHIEEIDYEEGKVLIHFKRWNHRYDEWVCWDSPYIRPLEKIQLRKEGLAEEEPPAAFRVNEQVLACWSDCRFYPAKINAVNKDGSYTVKFFDGVIQTVKNIHVKSLPKEQDNSARSKPREKVAETPPPSDKLRSKIKEPRNSSENPKIERELRKPSENTKLERELRRSSENTKTEREQRRPSENTKTEREQRRSSENTKIEREQRRSSENTKTEREQRRSSENTKIEREQRKPSENTRIERELRKPSENPKIERELRKPSENPKIERELRRPSENPKIEREQRRSSDNPKIERELRRPSENTKTEREQRRSSENTKIEREQRKPSENPKIERELRRPSENPKIERELRSSEKPKIEREQRKPSENTKTEREQRRPSENTKTEREQRRPSENTKTEREQRRSSENTKTEREQRRSSENTKIEREQRKPSENTRIERELRRPSENPKIERELRRPSENPKIERELRSSEKPKIEREQRKPSENTRIEKEKEKTNTTDKKPSQPAKDQKQPSSEKSKPGDKNVAKKEKEDKENISENERESATESRQEEKTGQNDNRKERRRKRERSSSMTSSDSSQTRQPATLELRKRKILIGSEVRPKKPRLERKKNVNEDAGSGKEDSSDEEVQRPADEMKEEKLSRKDEEEESRKEDEEEESRKEDDQKEEDGQAEDYVMDNGGEEVEVKGEECGKEEENGPSVSESPEEVVEMEVREQEVEAESVQTCDPPEELEVKAEEPAPEKPEPPEASQPPLSEAVGEPDKANAMNGLSEEKHDEVLENDIPVQNNQEIPAEPAPMKRTLRSESSTKYSREPLTNTLKKLDDPATKAVTLELEPNKFKCKILDCSKSFRKAKLLHYHMKYFHGVDKAEQDKGPATRHMQTRGSLAHEKANQQSSKRRRTTSGSLHTPLQISLRSSPQDGKDKLCEKRRHSSPATNNSNSHRPSMKDKSKENLSQNSHRKLDKLADNVKEKVKEKLKDLLNINSKKKKKKKKKSRSELSGSEENIDVSKELSPKNIPPAKPSSDLKLPSSVKTSDQPRRRDTRRLSADEKTLSDSSTESLLWSDEDYNDDIDVTDDDSDDEDDGRCEIVRCMCEVQEENDFMIQCEECLCWQHGVCMGLLEDTVPEKYTCYVCQDPPGQRVSLKYWYDKDWLNEGHMPGLSFLEENYSHQNAKKIVATHQLLGDVQRVIEVLHGLQLKMSILQSKEHPDLKLWGQPWKPHAVSDRFFFRRNLEENSCSKEDSTNYRTYNGAADKPSPIPSVEESYITSEHCYQKPRTYYPAVEQRLVVETRSSSLDAGVDRIRQSREDSIAERLGWELDRELLKLESESKHNYCKVRECLSKRNPPPESPHLQHMDNGEATVSSQLQWQLNLLTHLESLQDEVTHRMDFIEKELDVLESFLDYTGELEPPEPLARLPQLKHRIKQLLMDLGKVEQIALGST